MLQLQPYKINAHRVDLIAFAGKPWSGPVLTVSKLYLSEMP